MAEKKEAPKPMKQGGKGISPAKQRYNSENHEVKNKKIKAERHKRLLAKRAKRKAANPDYILPSVTKRLEKRAKKRSKAQEKI